MNYQKAAQSETQNQVIINELKTKVAQLDESLRRRNLEINDLKSCNAKAEEVAVRLNKELNAVKSNHKEVNSVMLKEHKSEIKLLKKSIGKLTGENIRLKKASKVVSAKPSKRLNKTDQDKKAPDETDAKETSYYDFSEVICSICGNIICDYTPKYFLGTEINPACKNCDDSDFDTEEDVSDECSEFSVKECIDKLDSHSDSAKIVKDHISIGFCNHSPQCISRQPYPLLYHPLGI